MYKKWLIPQNNLNANTIYHNQPVGNSPEFILLDMSLNSDIKRSHNFYCAVTSHICNNDATNLDQRKFSMHTMLMITRGIKRLVEHIWLPDQGVLFSTRIIHYCDQALGAMHIMFLHNSTIVSGLIDINGNSYTIARTGKQYGARVKKEVSDERKWLHPFAREVKNEKQKRIVQSFYTSRESESDDESDTCEEE